MMLNRFTRQLARLAPAQGRSERDARHAAEIRNMLDDDAADARAQLMGPVLLAAFIYVGMRIAFTYAAAAH